MLPVTWEQSREALLFQPDTVSSTSMSGRQVRCRLLSSGLSTVALICLRKDQKNDCHPHGRPSPHRQTAPKMKMTTDIPRGNHHAGHSRRLGSARLISSTASRTTPRSKRSMTTSTSSAACRHFSTRHARRVHAFMRCAKEFAAGCSRQPDRDSSSRNLMDSKSLFLTPNTRESIYTWMWLDLKDGPIVHRDAAQYPRHHR